MGTKQFDNYADLITFTRASGATLLDSDGLLKRAGHNLLTYSEEFDNAAWLTYAAGGGVTPTVAPNDGVAPDGTVSADLITISRTTTTGVSLLTQKTTDDGTLKVASIWLKAFEPKDVGKILDFWKYDGSVKSRIAVTLTDDWSLIELPAFSLAAGSAREHISFGFLDNGSLSPNTGVVQFYAWGAHLYRSDMPMVPNRNSGWTAETTYYPTTSAAYEAPRIEYDADGNRLGLLVEEQRTNLVTYSEEFDNAAWVKTNATVANDVIGPDGTLSGFTLNEGTAYGYHNIQAVNLFSADGNTRAWTLYVKKGSADYICISSYQLAYNSTGSRKIIFDFTTNSYSSIDGVTAINPVHVGNGWYRIGFTDNLNNASYDSFRIEFTNSNTIGSGVFSYLGTGRDVYIYGSQLEAGAFPTSYIPTSGSQATRAADVASITGADFKKWFNADEGTTYIDAASARNGSYALTIHDGTNNNYIVGGRLASSGSAGIVSANGAIQANFGSTATDAKIAFAYDTNDFAVSVNGGASANDTSGIIPIVNQVRIGAAYNGDININGHIKSIKYYPRRLTNAQLQELTQ